MNNNITRALPLVAMVLGDKLGCSVTVQGDSAFTNGKRINIPVLPENDKDSLIAVRGYLDHEAAHIRYTDMETFTKPEGFLGQMTNVLEDVRIEHLMASRFPGSKNNLNNLAELLDRQGFMRLPSPEEQEQLHPAGILTQWISLKLQAEKLLYSATVDPFEEIDELAHAVFPDELLDQIATATDPILQIESIEGVADVAKEVVTLIQNYIQEQQKREQQRQQEQQQQQQQEAASGSGQAQDQGPDSGDPSDDDSQQGHESQPDDDAQDQSSESNSDNDSSTDQGSDSDQEKEESSQGGQAGSSDLIKTLEAVLSASDDDLEGQDKGKAISSYLENQSETVDWDEAIRVPETIKAQPANGITLDRVVAASSKVRSKLTGLVQASRMKRYQPKSTGRKLDMRYLSRIPRNDQRIFASKQEQTAVNTAVLILIDRSGSMSGPRMKVARESALAAAIGIHSIPGSSVCVGSFPCGYNAGVIEVLPFGQNPRQRFKNFSINADGGTPMTEAVWWGITKLLSQKEPRKLLLVATDGDAYEPESTINAINRATENGIEVMGLGIQHPSVVNLFKNHKVIQTLEEMPAALMEMLQNKIIN